ncbi:MAG: hypothetical protein FJZ01_26695 [Candidatus Sericytochromatia bacterium]|nr:hypothetical protein [Candidatus Tanganyikabacteria bacterium]
MDPLRVVAFAEASLDEALPPGKFALAGRPNPPLADLPALQPDVVLICRDEFDAAVALAERALHAAPAAIVLVAGAGGAPTEKVLAAIRLGVRDVLPTAAPAEIREALERVWAQQRRGAGGSSAGEILVVHSPKGGSGKSAFAVNLACVLGRESGRDLVLVDLALDGGDLDLLLNVKPVATWPDLARCETFGAEEVDHALTPAAGGLRLLAAPARVEDAELVTVSVVERTLDLLSGRFPYVVVDTPSTLGEVTLRALELADRILMPVPLTLSALRRGQRLLRLWGQLGIKTADVVVVAWGQESYLRADTAKKLLQHPVDYLLPYDPKGIEQAINAGEILALSSPSGAYARTLASIASDLAGQHGKAPPRRAGFLGWLGIGDRRKSDVLARKA